MFLIGCAYVFGLPLFIGSTLPLKITVVVVLTTIIGQAVAWRIDGGRGRLWLYGILSIVAMCSAYFFVVEISWVFYLSSTRMPSMIRFICIGAAAMCTVLWGILIGRQVSAVLEKPEFVAHVFKDAGSEIQYRLTGIQQLVVFADSRGSISRLGLGLVLLAAPAVFVFGRIWTPFPASGDLLLFATLLMCPCSMLLAGIVVKACLLMIRLPRRLERIHGKPVVLVGD
ncbi:hypothetical protein WK66_23350 [Burkholderia ubonensis]|uniref:hypothetical protein n=1 Tax=Burkholderia ubonensis TaxID=101571 RepID=UPI0007528A7E|nr:hypothetical protein [Burkholderia ubonensis]KVU41054.1 hypothetical protein WK66_23350 [Burkholderia ubonensis]